MEPEPGESNPSSLRLVNWNVEWASAHTARGQTIQERIAATRPQVVCLTESHVNFFSTGHVATADANYGYGDQGTRRKVVLWSQAPWRDVEIVGEATLPGGRLVAATTETPLGAVRFVAVCIPWKDAHVRTGRKDREPWEDHLHYLDGLRRFLSNAPMQRLVLLGDFNQTIPRTHAPLPVFERLSQLLESFTCATSGSFADAPKPAIDHICHSPDLSATLNCVLSNEHAEIGQLSDHFGLSATIRIAMGP